MKLLLTSGGITNKTLANELEALLPESVADTKIGYVTTAMNVEEGDKSWHINQFDRLREYGYKWIDFVDPSAADVNWQRRLGQVALIMVGGGNTFHLLNQARLTGFADWLNDNIEDKVYVGISAGSIITTPNIGIAPIDEGDQNLCGIEDLTGLGWVDFEVSPHSPEDVSYEANAEYAKTTKNVLYAYDDNMAIKVIGRKMELVGEGKYKVFNK